MISECPEYGTRLEGLLTLEQRVTEKQCTWHHWTSAVRRHRESLPCRPTDPKNLAGSATKKRVGATDARMCRSTDLVEARSSTAAKVEVEEVEEVAAAAAAAAASRQADGHAL